jgi:hypothetical protein
MFWVLNSVIKPGLARRVDPGPGTRWLDQFGFNKRSAGATARPNPDDPGEPRRDPVFFLMWDLKPIIVYILYVPKKKVMFFQCGIKNLLV